jgi:hypothetical protein
LKKKEGRRNSMRSKRNANHNNNNYLFNEKLKIFNNILVSFEQVLVLIGPLIDKALLTEEAELYFKNGTIKEALNQLTKISNQCNELRFTSIPPEIFKNLVN